MALSTPAKRLPYSKHAAPSRPFPNVPDRHATASKVYIAVVTVPAVDDATDDAVVQWLNPPAADATADKTYVLSLAVTGDDTTGGSTAVPSWVEYTADLTP